MSLAPLRYAAGTVTIWHVGLYLGLVALEGLAASDGAAGSPSPFPGLLLTSFFIAWMYALAAPLVGQMVGERYPFAMVWPAAVVLACALAGANAVVSLLAGGTAVPLPAAFDFLLLAAALTPMICFALYVLPRLRGLPPHRRQRWGVRLQPPQDST